MNPSHSRRRPPFATNETNNFHNANIANANIANSNISAMTAPQLYDGEIPDTDTSYFTNQHAVPHHSMAMHMQHPMHANASDAARYPAPPPPLQPQRFGSADDEWSSATPRRMSFSDDPSLSPIAYRDHHHHPIHRTHPPPHTGTVSDNGRASPTTDGAVLPTLSTMLHHTWSPQQWPRAEPPSTTQAIPAQLLPPTHRRAPSLSVSTSPNFTSALVKPSRSWSWDGQRDVKAESPSSRYSPMHTSTPRSDTPDDAMEISPRGGSSSPSSYSTLSADDHQHDAAGSKPSSPAGKSERKTSRYLREMDRRAILERLGRGEKQATLAKEYNVSRAAICNLFKHRDEVMARTDEDPFAKHPKKRKNKKTLRSRRSRSLRLATASSSQGSGNRAVVTPPSAPSTVNQVQSDSVLLLLTIMSDRRSSADEFRRASERVLWLLIEEALSAVPIKLTQVTVAAESKIMGVTTEHPPCAISMEQDSSPMLDVFQLLEPERPFGQIRLLDAATHACSLVDTDLPPTLKYHNVFLFDIAVVSCDTMRAMIECAKERGALEVMIYVVALFVSADVVEMLHQMYPHVRVVTTQIESNILEAQKNRRSCVDVVLGRFDQVYQTQYTLV